MFNLFKKKIFTRKYLQKKSTKKHKEQWKRMLLGLGSAAALNAEKGEISFVFNWSVVKIAYNETRAHKDIFVDLKKTFKGCNIGFDTDLNGQTLCIISWKNT